MFHGLFEILALKIVDQVDVRFTAEGTFVLSHVAHKVRENKLHLCSKLSIKKMLLKRVRSHCKKEIEDACDGDRDS